MKLVALALIAACGGSAKPDTTTPEPASKGAVQADGFNEAGVKAMYAGNYALASEQFRNAIARAPEAKYFFNLCTSLFQEGKLADAKSACVAVDANQPAIADKAQKLIAKIDGEAKAQGVALEPDTTAVPASGGQAAIAAKLSDEGVQLVYAKKYAEASAKFREAVARVPEAKYFFNLCTSLFQEGKLGEALTACSAVGRNHPPSALQAKTNTMIERIHAEARAQNIQLDQSL